MDDQCSGRVEGYASIITHVLAQGRSLELISSFTGITLEDVKALAGKNQWLFPLSVFQRGGNLFHIQGYDSTPQGDEAFLFQ